MCFWSEAPKTVRESVEPNAAWMVQNHTNYTPSRAPDRLLREGLVTSFPILFLLLCYQHLIRYHELHDPLYLCMWRLKLLKPPEALESRKLSSSLVNVHVLLFSVEISKNVQTPPVFLRSFSLCSFLQKGRLLSTRYNQKIKDLLKGLDYT